MGGIDQDLTQVLYLILVHLHIYLREEVEAKFKTPASACRDKEWIFAAFTFWWWCPSGEWRCCGANVGK